MITVLDIIDALECLLCGDLARPADVHCTSCQAWVDHGVLPTGLESCRAALDVVADTADDTDGDHLLQELSDQLTRLEAARDARPGVQRP